MSKYHSKGYVKGVPVVWYFDCGLKKVLFSSEKVCIFAASFRQNGKIEESAFSLDSALGELGHFTEDYAGVRENDGLLGVYSYIHTIQQVELIKVPICIIQRESKPNQEG